MKHQKGVSPEKLERLRKAIEEQPDSATARMKYGTALYWNGGAPSFTGN